HDAFKKPDNKKLIGQVLSFYRKKSLTKYISDAYISEYKKEKESERQVVNTDSSRLNYYINIVLEGTSADEWRADAGGTLVVQYTIKPILNYLNIELAKYCNNAQKEMKKALKNQEKY